MTYRADLEGRLRRHYREEAGELRLPPLTWDQLVGRRAAAGDGGRRRWPALLVAASVTVLIAGGAIGSVVMVRARGDLGSASVPPTVAPTMALPDTVAPTAALPDTPTSAPTSPGPAPANCARPAILDMAALPNDVRIQTFLPELEPGTCFGEHEVRTVMGDGGQQYTVWASCTDCAEPTAAVATFQAHHLDAADVEAGSPSPESVTVGGRAAQYYAPAQPRVDGRPSTPPVSRLYVGDQWFVGWGLTDDQFVSFAAAVLASATPPGSVEGLQPVYEGMLGAYSVAGVVPLHWRLMMSTQPAGTTGVLVYSIAQFSAAAPPLLAYSWVLPGARLLDVDGRRALAFDPVPSYDDQQRLSVIVELDDATTVLWTESSAEVGAPGELAAIEVTPADFDDPRWDDIAWESGNSQGVG